VDVADHWRSGEGATVEEGRMFQRRRRLCSAIALTAVLALALVRPAGAMDRARWWDEGRQLTVDLLIRVLDRLGLAPRSGGLKCDPGAPLEPPGDNPPLRCPTAGSHIDPNGQPAVDGTTAEGSPEPFGGD
jgi:hypothetical protein